jgi:hypothetical protein
VRAADFNQAEQIRLEGASIFFGRYREHIIVLAEQYRCVIHQDVDETDLLSHHALRCGDALDARDVHPNRNCAAFVVFSQISVRAFEGRAVSSSQDDGKPFREQLASRLESEAAIRSRDERDAFFAIPHTGILASRGCSKSIGTLGHSLTSRDDDGPDLAHRFERAKWRHPSSSRVRRPR